MELEAILLIAAAVIAVCVVVAVLLCGRLDQLTFYCDRHWAFTEDTVSEWIDSACAEIEFLTNEFPDSLAEGTQVKESLTACMSKAAAPSRAQACRCAANDFYSFISRFSAFDNLEYEAVRTARMELSHCLDRQIASYNSIAEKYQELAGKPCFRIFAPLFQKRAYPVLCFSCRSHD